MSSVNDLLRKIKLTPVVDSTGKDHFEIHSLTSHQHLYFYLWGIKSFLWASKLNPKIIIHSDGTLTYADKKLLKSHINGCRIISKEEADSYINPFLKDYPTCHKYRSEQPFAKKIIDVFLTTKAEKNIILDSDVLFFKQPIEIMNWVNNDNRILFNWDSFDTEATMHHKLKKDLRLEYASGYNSGIQCVSKEIFDIEFLENYLSYCYRQRKLDWWVVEQRSMALFAYKYNPDLCKPLLRERYFFQNRKNVFYKNRGINTFPNSLVAKHYSRYARTLFATEGINKLLKDKNLTEKL